MLQIKYQKSDEEWEIYGQNFLKFNECEIIRFLTKNNEQNQESKKKKKNQLLFDEVKKNKKNELLFDEVKKKN